LLSNPELRNVHVITLRVRLSVTYSIYLIIIYLQIINLSFNISLYFHCFMLLHCVPNVGNGFTLLQVLCNRVLMWVAASGRQVPDDALQAGTTSVGEALYVGRVFHDGILTPGKVHTL